MPSILTKIAQGSGLLVLFRLIDRLLGVVSMMILARLLLPEDFGIVAMAVSVIALVELLGDFSFDLALIQNREATRSHYDTAWSFNVLFGFIACGLIALMAQPAAAFFDEPALRNVMFLIAFVPLVEGFENIGIVSFRKDLQFRKEFKYLLTKRMISFAVTIPLAFALRSYWALALGMLIGRLLTVGVTYLIHPFRPRPSLDAWRDLFGFSGWLVISKLIEFLRMRTADFVIGRFAGARALALYNLSYEISNLPANSLVAPVSRAVYPGYSAISDNQVELRNAFLTVLSAIAVVVLPAGFGIAVVADPLIPLLLGSNWIDAIPIAQLLAVFGALVAMQNSNGFVYLSLGRPKIVVATGAVYTLMLLTLLAVLVPERGAIGAALANVISSAVWLPIGYTIISRIIGIRVVQFVAVLWRPVSATTAMVIGVMSSLPPMMDRIGAAGGAGALTLALAILIGVIVYTVSLLTLWVIAGKPDGIERIIVMYLGRFVSRREIGSAGP